MRCIHWRCDPHGRELSWPCMRNVALVTVCLVDDRPCTHFWLFSSRTVGLQVGIGLIRNLPLDFCSAPRNMTAHRIQSSSSFSWFVYKLRRHTRTLRLCWLFSFHRWFTSQQQVGLSNRYFVSMMSRPSGATCTACCDLNLERLLVCCVVECDLVLSVSE